MITENKVTFSYPMSLDSRFIPLILSKRKTKTTRPIKQISDITPKWNVGDICFIREEFQKYYSEELHDYHIVYKTDFIDSKYCDLLYWESAKSMLSTDARFFVKILDVEQKKLHDLTEEELLAEGIDSFCDVDAPLSIKQDIYAKLWDDLYKDSLEYSYNNNPDVYVYTFELISAPFSSDNLISLKQYNSDKQPSICLDIYNMYKNEKQDRCCANCKHSTTFTSRYYKCDVFNNISVYKRCCKHWVWKYYDTFKEIIEDYNNV